MLLGERIRKIRLERHMTQDELAQAFGKSKWTLIRIEKGTAEPTFADIEKITRALGISFDDLLSDKKTAVVAAGNGGGNIVQINSGENNGAITQTVSGGVLQSNGESGGTPTNEAVSLPSAVYSDLESVLRFRREQPDLFELCANMRYTEKELRAIVSALLELRKKQE